MTRQLRVLILEDRPSDAELMLHELRQSGFEFEWERVETEEGYLVQLDPELDVILADYSLPQFDAMRALRLLQERGLDIPFIVVTGSVGEETAVACMKQGATDYLLKDRMARLAPAVEQALEAKQLRDERRLAQIALGESHSRFLTVLGGIDAHVYAADLATYEILFMNKQMQEDFGGNLVGKICWEVFRGESGPCPHCTNDKLLDADSKPTGLHVWEGQNPITGRWYLNYDRAIQWVDGRLVRLQVATDITERKLAEKALRESEARYRSLFEGVPVGLYRTTRKGKITDANPILVEMLGYPDRESLLGLSAADVFADAEEHSRQVALLEQDGELHGFEAQMRRSDGTTLWVRGTARAVRDDEGRVCSFEGSLEDVTGRKQAEGRLSAINALGKELMLSRDVGEIARSVADAAQEVLRFPICGLWLVDEKQNRLIRRAHTAGTNAPVVPPLPLDGDQGITVGTARSGQPICVPDVSQDPRYVAGSRQTLSELCVPLKVGDRVIGVLNAESDQLNAFGPADRQLLEALASVAAIALENARLYRETRELATFNEGIVQSMAEGIVVQDAEGYFTFVNPAGADLVGYTPAELTGKHWTSLVPPGQQPIVREADERRERGESDRYELEVVGKDGTRSSVLVSGSPRFDEEGRFVGTLAVFTDISRRKRAEEELGQRAAQLALLNDIGGKIAAVLDLDSVLDRAAALVQESFGYHHVALFTLNRDQGELIMRAAAGDFADLFPRDHWVELGQGLVGSAAERGESILAGDVAAGPSYVSFYPDLMPTRSELSIPIRVGEQVAGVLDIQSTELDAFNENDRMVMETLADQIAVAIENARLYEEAEQRALEQETLREAALAVTTALEREEVIERILAQLQKVVRYDTASVQLLKDERLEIVAARGFPEPEKLLGITVDPSRQDNPNSEVVRTRAPVVVDDVVPLYAEFGREPHAQAGIRSWLGVPMVVGERLIGMIALDKQEPDFYTEESARMAEAFAAQAAIAFDNARLHSETKRRLQEQIALREAGAAITSTLDLETLLARIAEQLGQAIDATSAYICPYSPVSMTSSVMAEYLGPHACDRERVSDLGAAYPYWEDDNEFLRIMEAGGHDISHVDDPDISEVERTHLKQHGGRSVLYIPLRVKDRALGYAELWESRRRREFTDEEIELCQAIARNASIAIENARLFEAERKQRALSEALAEAAAIVSSTLDPDQVLDRILEQVERVVAGDAFNVMLIEENTARVVRWRGYEPAEEEALSVQIGKYPNLMNMMQTEEPIVVQDTKADPDWVQAEGREWWRSYVAAPIRVTGLTVGLLNVIGRQPGQFGP
ncbi:MAG: GAF domain-containing protein, partial [Anaerolineae bacterium]